MKEQWKVGEIITLGKYQQSRTGASEPIEWKILSIAGENAFLTSVYALDAQPYHAAAGSAPAAVPPQNSGPVNLSAFIPSGFQEAAWETSTLRTWLNEDFKKAAFSAEEQACLLEADDKLKDQVSLLELDANINDAKLFPSDASTGCRATPYAASLYHDDIEAERQAKAKKPIPPRASYWLKQKGVVVHGDAMEGVLGITCLRFNLADKLAVRPVLLINLSRYEALLQGKQSGFGLSRLFKPKEPITHRFDDKEAKGTVKVDPQNHKIIAEGIGYPDLRVELRVQNELDKKNEQAIVMCLVAAIEGDAKAQNSLGSLFWLGQVVVQDYQEAAKWNQFAANQNLPDAMVDMADAYFNSKGVERNYEMAYSLCLKAAEKDFPLGMLNVAKCYAGGIGTERNIAEAIKWCSKAMNAGNKEAGALLEELLHLQNS